MALSKQFRIRKSAISKQVGIKEEYKCLQDGDSYIVRATFGVGGNARPTIPMLYTKDGFIPVTLRVDMKSIEVINKYFSSRVGLYSLLDTVMLVCTFHGKLVNGNWKYANIEFYLPSSVDLDGENLLCALVTDKGIPNSIQSSWIPQLRGLIANFMKQTINNKSLFLQKRVIQV